MIFAIFGMVFVNYKRNFNHSKTHKGGSIMTLVKWNPNRVLFNWTEDLYNELFNSRGFYNINRDNWYPQVDIEERVDDYVLNMELPGMKKEDIQISFRDGVLMVSGEKKDAREDVKVNFHLNERRYGKFERAFRIHSDIEAEKIEAHFQDGILQIGLPKAETAKPKQIEVKVK